MTIKKYPKRSFALFVSYSNRTYEKNIDQLKRIVNAFKVLFIAVNPSSILCVCADQSYRLEVARRQWDPRTEQGEKV